MIERDISGVALSLLHGVAMGADRIPAPKPRPPEEYSAFDFVVSANLLSQVAVVPLRFLAQRVPLSADAANAYARDIAKAHLDHLNDFGCVRCLIADTERRIVARDGTVQRTEAQLPGVALPPHNHSWRWELAPFWRNFPDQQHCSRCCRHHHAGGRTGGQRPINGAKRCRQPP
jgi:hypothetical protein